MVRGRWHLLEGIIHLYLGLGERLDDGRSGGSIICACLTIGQ